MIRTKHLQKPAPTILQPEKHLSKGGWSLCAEDLGGRGLGDTVGERELEVLGEELADVRALDVLGLLKLDNTDDLERA